MELPPRDEVMLYLFVLGPRLKQDQNVLAQYFGEGVIVCETTMMLKDGYPGADMPLSYFGLAFKDPEEAKNQFLYFERMSREHPNMLFSVSWPDQAKEWGKQFLLHVLKDVRRHLCSEEEHYKKFREKSKNTTDALVAATAAGISAAIGWTGALAIGSATLVLLLLMRVSTRSICEMTDDEVVNEIYPQPNVA